MSKKFYVPIEMTKKYVGENEIYATEDGEIIRITPDKIKVIIREGKLTEVYFAEVDNEDVYNEYMRSVWRADKQLQRGKRCWISNGKGKLVRCEKNCADCEHRNNTTLSIDLFDGGLNSDKTDLRTARPDEILEDAELLKALWERVGELCSDDQTIIKMFGEGFPESKIADVVGMTQPAVNYRKRKILKELKKSLESFL